MLRKWDNFRKEDKMKIKKRQIIAAALILALGTAVFLNYNHSKPEAKKTNGAVSSESTVNLGDAQFVNGTSVSEQKDDKDYFAAVKTKRKTAHDESFEIQKKIIDDKNADEKAKKQASDTLTELSNAVKAENDTQALITAKIKKECAVFINNNKVQVVVGKDILNENTILKIQEIVTNQTGISAKNITIIELNS